MLDNFNLLENNTIKNKNNLLYLKANNINFFNSIFKKEESIININRYTFYKNIYIFINRFKIIITIKSYKKI